MLNINDINLSYQRGKQKLLNENWSCRKRKSSSPLCSQYSNSKKRNSLSTLTKEIKQKTKQTNKKHPHHSGHISWILKNQLYIKTDITAI